MKTIIVLSALASIALAAPAPLGDGLKPTQEILWPKSIKRERKSPTFGKLGHVHGSHVIVHEPVVSHPVHHHIIEDSHHIGYQPAYGHGLHHGHYRSQEEGVAIEKTKQMCAKEVEAKCGLEREDANESAELKLSATDETNLESNIIMARTAVKNIQHNLEEMEKTASTRAAWKHAKTESDIALHENIDTARAALEHVQKSFNGLHSMNQHAAAKAAETENLEKMSEEQRMAQWKEAIENIQKNVEIANNIKDSFRFTTNDEEKTVTSGTSSAITQHGDKLETEKHHALEKKTEKNEMETSASHSKKVISKPETQENSFQKHSKQENDKSQIKFSNVDAKEHLDINKNDKNKDENKDLHLEQAKNVELSAMSMKSSENNKDLHHDTDANTENIAKLNIEVKDKHNLAGKAVDNIEVKTEQKEIQQKWHHENRDQDTAAREDMKNESLNVEEKSAHINSANLLMKPETKSDQLKMRHDIHHDTESQDFSKAREDFKAKSANNDFAKLDMKTDQMKTRNENAHLNTESLKTIEHQDISKTRENDKKSSIHGRANLGSKKTSEDMMHHESAPVASVVSMKSADTEVSKQNMKGQSVLSKKESEKSQINFEQGKNAEPMKTGSHFLDVQNNQLESKSSINIAQQHAMGTEHVKDAEFIQTRRSEADLNLNQKTSMKSADHFQNKQNVAFEHSMKSKDSGTEIGKSADMDLDLNLMRNTVGKAAMEKNSGWRKSHHHDSSARFGYGPSVVASPSGGYGGSAAGNGAGASLGAGAGHSSGSAGAVGVFPNAKVGGCAVPLLLSCSPSVVAGTLAKTHSAGYSGAAGYGATSGASSHAVIAGASAAAYGAPAYKSSEGFNFHNKRDTKKINLTTVPRRIPRIHSRKTPTSDMY